MTVRRDLRREKAIGAECQENDYHAASLSISEHMPGVPKNTPILPPFWAGDYSLYSRPPGGYLSFLIFMTLMVILVLSLMMAWEGNFLMSGARASILATSVLAIWWLKFRIPRDPSEDEM